jgi:hypothetical protein
MPTTHLAIQKYISNIGLLGQNELIEQVEINTRKLNQGTPS